MDYKLTTLSTGLRLLTVEMPNLESASVTVWVGVGSRYERKEKAGISHFLEHMVFKGTKKRETASDVSLAIDSIGSESNAATAQEWTNFYIKARAGQIEKAFDILSDLVLCPLLRQEDIDREKGVIIEEIAMKEDIPMEKIGDKFVELMFEGNPLARDIAGYTETVKGITRNDFLRYRRLHYDAKNIVITVSGGIKNGEVKELTRKYFSPLKGKRFETPKLFSPSQKRPKLHVEKKKSEQAHFFLGFFGHPHTHPDRYAQSLLATILGRGMSSRLFTEIREKRGLAYSIGTSVSRYVDTGIFATYAGVDIKKAEEAIKVILDQTYGLKEKVYPVADAELKKAKEYLKGRMALSLEDTLSVNDFFGQEVMFMDKIVTPDEAFAKVDKVTVPDIERVAKDLFNPKKLNLAIIGPFRENSKFEKLIS